MIADDEFDLTLKGIGKSYGALQVLHPTDLQVRSGEFLTIVGPSGSGKTTLLRLISGFTEASCGTVCFKGQDITAVPTHKRPFNTVFQDYALFPHMTVAENVGYGLMIRREAKDKIARKVQEALAIVGLEKLLDRRPSQLSGGQRQRVALARALVCEPQVLLLDEPLSALDAEMRYQMQVFLKDLQRRVHTTFILVTHDQEEAITMSDRIAVMSAGRVEQIGSHRDVYYAPQTSFVASFFGDNNLIDAKGLGGELIDTPFGSLRVEGVDVGANAPLTLTLRPEFLSIERPDRKAGQNPSADNIVSANARVRKITFAGPLTRVAVTTESNPPLELQVKLGSGQLSWSLEEGQLVAISFAMRDLGIVAVKGSAGIEETGPLSCQRTQQESASR